MRILYFTQYFPPEVGATQSRAYEMSTRLVKMGHEVTVIAEVPNHPSGIISPKYKGKLYFTSEEDGIKIIRVWVKTSPEKKFRNRIWFYLSYMINSSFAGLLVSQNRYDIVLASSPPLFVGGSALFLHYLKRIPFIFEVRDLWPEQILVVKAMKQNVVIRLLFRLARYLYHHADRVVTVGDGYKEKIQADYNISEEQIDVIPNGILPEMFTRNGRRNEIRKQLGWCGKFVVLYLGTHGMSHKLETVMDAAESLESNSELVFAFVGEGAEKEKLLRVKEDRELDNCLFYKMQPREKVPDFYEAADACVVPLLRCELFRGNYPSKMFESMAMECPIILSSEGYSQKILNETRDYQILFKYNRASVELS